MNIYLYSTKLFRDNFTVFLYLYESLNYKLSSMRNNYISLKNRYCSRDISLIITTKKRRLGAELLDIKNY